MLQASPVRSESLSWLPSRCPVSKKGRQGAVKGAMEVAGGWGLAEGQAAGGGWVLGLAEG